MLEGLLERLLLRFLDPYVDGIARDKLHLGVFSGSLELRDLRVKREAPALLGVNYLRVANGGLGLIRIKVPWKTLFSAKVSVEVSGVDVLLEHVALGRQDEEMLADMRASKRKTLALRSRQLRELVAEQAEEGNDAEGGGDAAGLVRKVVNNLQLEFSRLSAAFKSEAGGFAASADLPTLTVLSADDQFRTGQKRDEEVAPSGALYKVLRLQDLVLRMAPAGSSNLDDAGYLLSPVSAGIQFAHVPKDKTLLLRVQFADGAGSRAAIRLLRSQSKHLLGLSAKMGSESQRLEALMAPPAAVEALLSTDGGRSALDEYAQLFKRNALWERALEEEGRLDDVELERLNSLEDLMPVLLLARQRYQVETQVELLEAEMARRRGEREKEQKKKQGFFGRMFGRAPKKDAAPVEELMTKEEREQLLKEVADETKVEPVELPQSFNIELALGSTAVDLVDDRFGEGDAQRQLLSLDLAGSTTTLGLAMREDHRGNSTAEFCLELQVLRFVAQQYGQHLLETTVDEDQEGAGVALRLLLRNRLEASRSVLRIEVDQIPLRICAAEGMVGPLVDFFKKPEPAIIDVATSAAGGGVEEGEASAALRRDELLDFSKQLIAARAGQAKEVVSKVYERLPDALELEVMVASPVLEVPMKGTGMATISLGSLYLVTPQASAYNDIALDISVSNAIIAAKSARGEQFDVLQPVPMKLGIRFSNADGESKISLDAQVKSLLLALAPQACRILLQVPTALQAIFSSDTADADGGSTGAAVPEKQHEHVSAAKRLANVTAIVEEVALADDEAASALAQAKAKVDAIKQSRFAFNLGVSLEKFQLTLSDSIVPVMRVYLQVPNPGLQFALQRVPDTLPTMSATLKDASVDLDFMNPRHGYFEPVVEHFSLDINFDRSQDAKQKRALTHVVLSGHRPLLVNLSPTTVRTTAWFLPVFLSSFKASTKEALAIEQQEVAGVNECKYRVINLCDKSFTLEFESSHKKGLSLKVDPTGSDWKSLDEFILPHFSESITVQAVGADASSLPLALDRGNRCVVVPGAGDCVAELLTPHPSYRLLLIGPCLRLHNQTNLPLVVNFAGEQGPVVTGGKSTSVCDAGLLGWSPASCTARSALSDGALAETQSPNDGILLAPNSMCAVPASARLGSVKRDLLRTALSVRVASASFCEATKVGTKILDTVLSCPGGIHFVCGSRTEPTPLPAVGKITTVYILPTLTLVNALPAGNVSVGLSAGGGAKSAFTDFRMASLESVNVYDCPTVLKNGVKLRARLEDDVPWSSTLAFGSNVLLGRAVQDDEADSSEALELRQRPDGAAATVLASPSGKLELRLECSHWFVDRCGFEGAYSLAVCFRKQPLPCYDGITFMPQAHLEEPCELRLLKSRECISTCSLRMPTAWSNTTWSTPSHGPLVLSVQAEGVAPADLRGARCQSYVLRPRLVLTNTSKQDIEVSFSANPAPQKLSGGQSFAMHWNADPSEAFPAVEVRFRPINSAAGARAWSPPLLCSEAAAGSSALALVDSSGKRPDVWSVDVAPYKGSLAVSFREGSPHVVKNMATEADVDVSVQTSSLKPTSAALPSFSVSRSDEVALGWPQAGRARAVSLTVSGKDKSGVQKSVKLQLNEIRQLKRTPVPELGVVVKTYTNGSIAVKDGDEHSADITASLTTVEVKLARVGVSLIQDNPVPREFLYLQLELLRLNWQADGAVQDLRLLVSEGQVDCQLAGRADASGGSGNAEARKARENDALGLLTREKRAVLVANCADGDNPLLNLALQLGASSGPDILLNRADVSLDSIDLIVDDEWLNRVGQFAKECTDVAGGRNGQQLESLRASASKSILFEYVPPQLPKVLQVDSLDLSTVDLTLWASVKLRSVFFLPPHLLTAIRILSFSGQLTLDGAKLSLPKRAFPFYRGSLKDFLTGLASEYTMNLVAATAAILGKSSLLNVPRVPLKLGGAGASFLAESVGLAADGATSALAFLTFDKEYAERQQQIRKNKKITGAGDGLAEAGKSLASGLAGFTDVFTKPTEGLKSGGFGGFMSGLAGGVVGAVAKPISGIGNAISDVGAGVAAQVNQISGVRTQESIRVEGRSRSRPPRLLYSVEGVVRPWSDVDAAVLKQLGAASAKGVQAVLPLATREGRWRHVLLLFVDKLLLAQVASAKAAAAEEGAKRRSGDGGVLGAQALFSHALKPLSVVAAGVKELAEGNNDEVVEEPGDPAVLRRACQLQFTELAGVKEQTGSGGEITALTLEVKGGGTLPLELDEGASAASKGDRANWEGDGILGATCCGPDVRAALAAGLRSVIESKATSVDWVQLVVAQRADLRGASASTAGRRSAARTDSASGGQLLLEVFEYERVLIIGSGHWKTPFLPTDWEAAWRWVDASGRRHPHLRKGLSQDEATQCSEPPCEPPGLLKPLGGWRVTPSEITDADGWSYAVAFNSSTWDARPGLFDAVRKRRWVRSYS
eukprot:TRINITY_DN5580_c0_g3_i1.p1 TRINITY_DN5580_c0_g3~~TRINITY_DN5580_c0_g3_i1.p1  ORF type:complete len:2456 (+),score=530.05 TRINITY_DN5580_c0_g3_i1:91-7458(+)